MAKKTKHQQASPPAAAAAATADWCSGSDAANADQLSARGGERVDAGEVAMVRRSSIAPLLVCRLCGGILREATTVSECLHTFCGKCISEKFKDEDNKRCPTCNIDLGCDPKLRADRSLQCISSVIFPANRKREEFSSLHPELVLLPSLTSQANEAYHSGYKIDAHLVGDPMNTMDTAAEGRTACEAEKKTARISELIEIYIDQTQASKAKTARRKETYRSHQLRSAMFPDVCLVAEPVDSETETNANERLGMESFASPEVLGQSQLTSSDGIQSQVSKDFSRLNEELENAISEQTVAFERAKVLKERHKKQAERLQIEYKRSQETEAAQKEALRENRALKQEIAEKNEELSNLKNNFTMILKRNTQVEQRNAVLEDQIDHVNRLLEAENSNTRELSEQLGKAVNEKNKLTRELVQMSKTWQRQVEQADLLVSENKRLTSENKRLLEAVKNLEKRLEGERQDAERQHLHMERLGSEKQKLAELLQSTETRLAEAMDELGKVRSKLAVVAEERNVLATDKLLAQEMVATEKLLAQEMVSRLEGERDAAVGTQEKIAAELELIRTSSKRQFQDLELRLGSTSEKLRIVIAGIKPILDLIDPEPVRQAPLDPDLDYEQPPPPPPGTFLERCKTAFARWKVYTKSVTSSAAGHALAVVLSHYPSMELDRIDTGFVADITDAEVLKLEVEVEETAVGLADDLILFEEDQQALLSFDPDATFFQREFSRRENKSTRYIVR